MRDCPLVVAVGLATVPEKTTPLIPAALVLCNSIRSVLFAPEILKLPRPAAKVEDEAITSEASASGTIRIPTFPVVVAVVAAIVLGVVAPMAVELRPVDVITARCADTPALSRVTKLNWPATCPPETLATVAAMYAASS